MIQIELYYQTSVASIRSEQANYLKKEKRQPFPQELPKVEEASAEEYAKMKFFQKVVYFFALRKARKRYRKALRAQKVPVDERILRGYNAGIEMALKVLACEYEVFKRRIEKEQ